MDVEGSACSTLADGDPLLKAQNESLRVELKNLEDRAEQARECQKRRKSVSEGRTEETEQ